MLVLAGVVIGLLVNRGSESTPDDALYAENANKLDRVMQLVRKKYVDSVNVDSVEGATINNLLQKLDPHSVYLHQKQARSLSEKLEGGFDGVGIESQILRDTLVVTQVIPGGPAAKAELPNGARIISINGQPFAGIHLSNDKVNDAFDVKNKAIELGVLGPDGTSTKRYVLKRGHITISSLDAAYMTAPATGYVKIGKFGSSTDMDFKAALRRLKKEGMTKLVLDLRGNGGGYLNTATALADEFLPKNRLIVYTKGLHEPRTDYFATDSGLFERGKLAVLVDEHSASASEILAGALQDLDRAVIVGRRSFGKGLVQEQFEFEDGTALNLTVARYFTPSGRSIQRSYKNGTESYRNDLNERLQKGELYAPDSDQGDSTFDTSVAFHTSAGRKVYGGGGIMPDIFVPEDMSMNAQLVQDLARNQVFSAYVIDHMQMVLRNYRTAHDFVQFYNVSDLDLNNFLTYANGMVGNIDSRDVAANKSFLKTMLKAQAARFKWGSEWYFRVMNQNDAGVQKAVEAIN